MEFARQNRFESLVERIDEIAVHKSEERLSSSERQTVRKGVVASLSSHTRSIITQNFELY